jgi:DNA-binding NarL/FixJ family response regulator
MEKRLRIVVADDHPMVREGIRMCLKDWDELTIVAEASNGEEAVEQVRAAQPDIVLLDLTMPRMGGLEALPKIRRARAKTRVIILTVHNTQEYVRQAIAANVDGYLLKDTTPTEYVEAIRTVAAGRFFISPAVAQHVKHDDSAQSDYQFGLTSREFQYLLLAARGGRLADIAEMMKCSEGTAKTFRKRVYRKLGIHSAAELAQFAITHRL